MVRECYIQRTEQDELWNLCFALLDTNHAPLFKRYATAEH